MFIDYEMSKNTYLKIAFREFLFRRLYNPIVFIIYLEFLQVGYSLAKYGGLDKNIPIFLVTGGLLLLVLVEFVFNLFRNYKNSSYRESWSLRISEKNIELRGKEPTVLKWSELVRSRESKEWYFLYFSKKRFIPLSKKLLRDTEIDELQGIIIKYKKTYKIRLRYVIVLLWMSITFIGLFAIGKSAVDFNGKLSWYLHSIENTATVKLENNNIYEIGLDDLLQSVDKKLNLMDHLMPKNFSLDFGVDGRIKSFDTYIYGYDNNYKLKMGYLIYYDSAESNKVTIRIQDFDGIDLSNQPVYKANNDIRFLVFMLNQIPLQEEVQEWDEEVYSLLYKGYYSWGYNTEGIRFINKEGLINIEEFALEEIVGPSLSLYSKEDDDKVIPKRYVYRE